MKMSLMNVSVIQSPIITDLLTKDEIEELAELEAIKTFKDDTLTDIYGDTPTVSHIIHL